MVGFDHDEEGLGAEGWFAGSGCWALETLRIEATFSFSFFCSLSMAVLRRGGTHRSPSCTLVPPGGSLSVGRPPGGWLGSPGSVV